MSSGLRIILDKSVVWGLNNAEIDSLDSYFFQIVPPILTNEILADLSKQDHKIKNRISAHSYRISGDRGITLSYVNILGHSLMGTEIPMDGRFVPAGHKMVQSDEGVVGEFVETSLEDETIARWESRNFHEYEKTWAERWRRSKERRINPKIYTDKISQAGLNFTPPESDEELFETVDILLKERFFQGKLLVLLSKEHNIPYKFQKRIINRWFQEGKPMLKDFAPYAFFCVRVNLLWALGLTNPTLFKHDKNDRKDIEYCYYLPHCEIFSSKDDKHKRLIPFLKRSDQSFIGGEELKEDLRRLSEEWDKTSREDKIRIRAERGSAPPEDENSIIFQFWKKHRGKISAPISLDILKAKIVDSNLPVEEQIEMTLEQWLQSKFDEIKDSEELSPDKIDKLQEENGEPLRGKFLRSTRKISKKRLLKMFPQLEESDLEKGSD